MYNFDADIYNIDAHFTEEGTSMVSFQSVTNIGSIVFVGPKGSGKYSLLGQIIDKFRRAPGSSKEEHESKNVEIRNVMFRFPIVYTSQQPTELQEHKEYFDNCAAIVYVVDVNKEINSEYANSIQFIRNSMLKTPSVHVFLNKKDLLSSSHTLDQTQSRVHESKAALKSIFKNPTFYETSISDGTSLVALSSVLESVIEVNQQMHEAMDQFARSLELTSAFLVDLQTKSVFVSGGENSDPETYRLIQNGTEMFVSLATMMDAKTAQSVCTIELGGRFFHFFWSAFDVILVGVSKSRIPVATAKNNAMVLLHILKKMLNVNTA